MSKDIYRVDFHTHPLSHLHYPDVKPTAELTNGDRKAIQDMVALGIHRGLDAMAITDHDQFTSGLYAAKYARENNLPIKVIPGAECQVFVRGQEVHVLALGVNSPLDLKLNDSIGKFVDKVHAAGGLAVLSHPHYYPHLFPLLNDYVDGVEEYNGVNAANRPHQAIFDAAGAGFTGFLTRGSDFHLDYAGCWPHPAQIAAVTEVDASYGKMYDLVRGLI